MKCCPHCGKQDSISVYAQYFKNGANMLEPYESWIDYTDRTRYAVICDISKGGCGAGGGYYVTVGDAILNWDRRKG